MDLRAGLGSHRACLLPLVFVLWANLHIQFIYGLLVLGLGCVAPLFDALLARRRKDVAGPAFSWKFLLLTAGCAWRR